ncbi:MAG: bifunctional UDP-sugar hydrolase/5'-nucleotidase [Vulcanimicrobiota bacterium]
MKLRCLLLLVLLATLPAAAERVFILHTNDLHGYLEPAEEGGEARIATLVRAMRAAFPGQVILLDAGDLAQGTPLSGLFFGEPVAKTLDLLDYDAICIGNHEFDWGSERMTAMLEGAHQPVVCANLVKTDGTRPYPPYEIVTRTGVRVAVVGLITPDTPNVSSPGGTTGYKFLDPSISLRALLPELEDKADLIVALTHLGVEADKQLAKDVPEVDLIVGGHSHTPLFHPVYEGQVPIVQAGSYARYLGVLELEVDVPARKISQFDYHLLQLDDSVAPDPAVMALLQPYKVDVEQRMAEEVGKLTQTVTKEADENNYDSRLGNLICDVFLASTGADLALYNRGGIRANSLEAGPITLGDLYKLLPFNDPIVVLEVPGRELAAILLQGAEQAKLSGAGVNAVIAVNSGEVRSLTVGGQPVLPEKTYKLAVTGFLAAGGDGMGGLPNFPVVERFDYGRDLFAKHFKKVKTIVPPQAGRLRRL